MARQTTSVPSGQAAAQTVTIPSNYAGGFTFDLAGAQGGPSGPGPSISPNPQTLGGLGARITGGYGPAVGDTLYVYVAEQGGQGITGAGGAGGWGYHSGGPGGPDAGGGGGSTALLDGATLIAEAAGGGGTSSVNALGNAYGGGNGGQNGATGSGGGGSTINAAGGAPGTANGAGAGGAGATDAQYGNGLAGSAGTGGNGGQGGTSTYGGGGGGAGAYGAGGGGSAVGGNDGTAGGGGGFSQNSAGSSPVFFDGYQAGAGTATLTWLVKPTATPTAPANGGTVTATATPTLSASFSDPVTGVGQQAYRVIVYAVPGGGLPAVTQGDPSQTTPQPTLIPLFDSGVTYNSTNGISVVPDPLPNGTLVAYFAVEDAAGNDSAWSAWSSTQWTQNAPQPQAPTFTVTPLTSQARTRLVIAASQGNLLTAEDSTINPDTGSWAGTNVTLSRSTTVVLGGSDSLQVQAAAGISSMSAATGYYTVAAGQSYVPMLAVRAATAAQTNTFQVTINFYDSAHNLLSSAETAATDSASWWATMAEVATAPSGASYATLEANFPTVAPGRINPPNNLGATTSTNGGNIGPGVTRYYKVTAVDASGETTASNEASIATLGQLAAPVAPTVTPAGTAGTTHYDYEVTALDASGGETTVSAVGSTTTGNATLSGTNYNALSWSGVAGAASYNVYRVQNGTLDAFTSNPPSGANGSTVGAPTSGSITITTATANEVINIGLVMYAPAGAPTVTLDGTALTVRTSSGPAGGNNAWMFDAIAAAAGSHTISWTFSGTNNFAIYLVTVQAIRNATTAGAVYATGTAIPAHSGYMVNLQADIVTGAPTAPAPSGGEAVSAMSNGNYGNLASWRVSGWYTGLSNETATFSSAGVSGWVSLTAAYPQAGTAKIGNTTTTSFNDTGQAASGAAPTTNTTRETSSNTLSWAAAAGASSYRIYAGTTAGAETLQASGITGTTWTDTAAALSTGGAAVPTTNTTSSESHYIAQGGIFPGDTLGYQLQVLADQPAAYWPLTDTSGSATAANAAGSGTGTASGTVTFGVPGMIASDPTQTAATFDGTTGRIDCGSLAALTGASTLTLQAAVQTTDTTAGIHCIAGQANRLSLNTSGTTVVASNGTSQVSWSPAIFDGKTHRLTLVAAGGNVTLTVDGAAQTTQALPIGTGTTYNFTIGARNSAASTYDRYFNGTIGHVAAYTTAPTAARLTAQYQAMTGTTGHIVQKWVAGGNLPTQFTVQRSTDNGSTWTTVFGGSTIPAGVAGSQVTFDDVGCPRETPVLYRAQGVEVAPNGNQFVSSWSGTQSTYLSNDGQVWIFSAAGEAYATPIVYQGPNLAASSHEDQQVFYPEGRDDAVVFHGTIHDEQFISGIGSQLLTFGFPNDAAWQNFKAMRAARKPVLLKTVYGDTALEQFWLSLGAEAGTTRIGHGGRENAGGARPPQIRTVQIGGYVVKEPT